MGELRLLIARTHHWDTGHGLHQLLNLCFGESPSLPQASFPSSGKYRWLHSEGRGRVWAAIANLHCLLCLTDDGGAALGLCCPSSVLEEYLVYTAQEMFVMYSRPSI